MTALAQARLTKRLSPTVPDFVQSESAFPGIAASTSIYHGAIVGLNSSGYAGPASIGTFNNVIGVADLMPTTTGGVANNSAGSAGDITIRVRTGVFAFNNSSSGDAITNAWIGKPCFLVDDNTVAKTSNAGARCVAGTVWAVDSNYVWVQMGPGFGNTIDINHPVTITRTTIVDATAATTTAEQVVGTTRIALTAANITVCSGAALTANDSDYATITIAQGDGAAGARTTLATATTKTSGGGGTGNWTAFSKVALTLSSTSIPAGGIITWTVGKTGNGVTIPVTLVEITGYPY